MRVVRPATATSSGKPRRWTQLARVWATGKPSEPQGKLKTSNMSHACQLTCMIVLLIYLSIYYSYVFIYLSTFSRLMNIYLCTFISITTFVAVTWNWRKADSNEWRRGFSFAVDQQWLPRTLKIMIVYTSSVPRRACSLSSMLEILYGVFYWVTTICVFQTL